jgi:hypothetical protein
VHLCKVRFLLFLGEGEERLRKLGPSIFSNLIEWANN